MKKFNVFDPVLIRISNKARWSADFYDHLIENGRGHCCITGALIKDENILPYNEETKHLHNTVGEFVEWKPKKGEPILVRDTDNEGWSLRIFLEMHSDCYVCTPEYGATSSPYVWAQAKPYTSPFEE